MRSLSFPTLVLSSVGLLSACTERSGARSVRDDTAGSAAPDSGAADDTGASDTGSGDTGAAPAWDAYADAVVDFSPGDFAGYGADKLPDVVLGPPLGGGEGSGSLDVLTLGQGGSIVLEFSDYTLVDGEGVDLIVAENPFSSWVELGVVAVSDDGENWFEWPCDSADVDGGYPGCAGKNPVYGNPNNGIEPTDPAVAGGDQYDLADLGIPRARFVRIRDTGDNDHAYLGNTGGFDLDAVVVVNGELVAP